MTTMTTEKPRFAIKEPKNLSARVQWLRDYYFEGVKRKWNNEYTSWTTGTPWDFQYNELSFYIVPETYFYIPTFRSSFKQIAKPVALDKDFWKWSLPERRAWFLNEVMVKYLPKEILPGDLLAGARFNVMTSHCLTEKETKEYDKLVKGKGGAREAMLWFHNHGYGNCRRHQRAPGARLRAGHRARLERHPRRPAEALCLSDRSGQAGQARRAAAGDDHRVHAGARPGQRVPQAAGGSWRPRKPTRSAKRELRADGGEPGAGCRGSRRAPSGKPCSPCG